MALDKFYRRDGNIVSRRVLDDTLLVPIRGELADLQRIFALNETAQRIWTALDGEHDLASVRDSLVTHFAVEPAQAETDLLEFVAQLSAVGLVAEVR